MGDTGVQEKMTNVTITTTRFTQLPTECVRGDTFASIMNDTCYQKPDTINTKEKVSLAALIQQ